MKTLTKIAALTIVAGGFLVVGMSSSADAGDYYAPAYGHGYYSPLIVTDHHLPVHHNVYGHNSFINDHGISYNVYVAPYANHYFDNYHGTRHFVLGH